MSAESATAPRDAYVYDLEHGKLERWTHSEAGALDPATLIAPELVRFPTWDRDRRSPAAPVRLGLPAGAGERSVAGDHQYPRRT